jgi:hypothetical protein
MTSESDEKPGSEAGAAGIKRSNVSRRRTPSMFSYPWTPRAQGNGW